MISRVHPHLESNDGTFWISFKDFLRYFAQLSVCKVRNWNDVRVKGKFVKVQDVDDKNLEVVLSKWYYSVEIPRR